MSPIVTLQWASGVAYGPRGSRYQIASLDCLSECRVYSPEHPGGELVISGTTPEGAMIAAQHHCEILTLRYGAESDTISAGSRSQLTRR